MHRVPRSTNVMKELYAITSPGGFLFWTSPFLAPQEADGGEFVKYTFQGASHVTAKGEYTVLNVVGVGNRNMALAELAGLKADQVRAFPIGHACVTKNPGLWILQRLQC